MFLQRRSAVTATHGIHTLAAFRAAVRPNQLRVIRSNSTVGLNWYAIFLGYPILGVWYWCTDQTIVQRVTSLRWIPEDPADVPACFAGRPAAFKGNYHLLIRNQCRLNEHHLNLVYWQTA
jgi:hypothetical protein